MIKSIMTGALALTTLGTGASAIALNTQTSVNVAYESLFDSTISYSVAEMLTLAIEDEYSAKATYQALLVLFPQEKILEHLLSAEQKHINALVPLFETYNVTIPLESTIPLTVTYGSIQEAALDIVAKEVSNIAMYAHFLIQSDLPSDVEFLFTNLMNASIKHQAAGERVAANGTNSFAMFGNKPNIGRAKFVKGPRAVGILNNRFVQSQRNTAMNDGVCDVEELPETVEGSDE
jgi:hypothetical protein